MMAPDGPAVRGNLRMGKLLVVRPDPALEHELRGDRELSVHQIQFCDSNLEALRLAGAGEVDVLVTEATTSIGDDLKLAAEVRAVGPGVKFVVLAPSATHAELVAAMHAHVFTLFTAPLEYIEIAGMARAALEAVDWRDGIEVVSALPQWMTLKVSCHLLTAERLVRFMTEHESSLPVRDRDLLLAAFREVLVNAMEHGAGFDPEKVIEVTAARTARAIVYHFRDPGGGFNRARIEHAAESTTPEAVMTSALRRAELGLRPGGLGMLIVRQIVDEVVYNERGNEVLLIKHLN